MAKYTVHEMDNSTSIHENGEVYLPCLSFGIAKTKKIAKSLNLYASLTPPEGIVAGEKKVAVEGCITGDWYCSCIKDSEWVQFNTNGGYLAFVRLHNGQLEIIPAEHTAEMVYPALDLDCTVGEIGIGKKCIINGKEYTRLGSTDGDHIEMLNDGFFPVPFPADYDCRRVPKGGE